MDDKKSINYYHFGFTEADLQNATKNTISIPDEEIHFFPTKNLHMPSSKNDIIDFLQNALKTIEDDVGNDDDNQRRQSKSAVNNRKISYSPYKPLRRSQRTKITSSRMSMYH